MVNKTSFDVNIPILQDAILLLFEDIGRLYPLQVLDGLKSLFNAKIDAHDFFVAFNSLMDMEAISMDFPGSTPRWKIDKKFLGRIHSKVRAMLEEGYLDKKKYTKWKTAINKNLPQFS